MEEKSNESQTTATSDFVDISGAIKQILFENDLKSFEPEVMQNLEAFAENILIRAKMYMEHAGRTEMSAADVKLAVNEGSDKIAETRISRQKLMELAKEHNKSKLPDINEIFGLAIPNEALTNCNLRIKGLNKPQPLQYAFNNQTVTINPPRNASGSQTIVRSSTGSMPQNSNTPQRIVFKPRIVAGKCGPYNEDNSIKKRKTV